MSEEVIVVEWAETGASEEGCQVQLITDNASAVLPDSLVQNVLVNTVVQGQEGDRPLLDDKGNDLYCEECHASYKDQCDVEGRLSFMLDSSTPMGLPQRALLTLPHGLVVGRSSIPGAGLGVLNQGAIVAPGMHFGPCEGEVTTRDSAVTSDYSWEVWNSKGESEYIDSARDTHSNWMRYVNCARNAEEGNLTALQYRGNVFFHCCRSILPGDELLFWPGGRFIDTFKDPSDEIWLRKSTPSEVTTDLSSQVFICCQCQLSFTTETYIQRHKEQLHPLDLSPVSALCELDKHLSNRNMNPDSMSSSVGELGYRCPQRPKSFKQKGHVQRNMRAVHSNVRPYCCPQCRKCFAQGYDLARHHLRVHGTKKKRGVVEVRGEEVREESSLPPPSDSAWEPEPPSNDPPTETQTGRAPSQQRLRNLRVKSTKPAFMSEEVIVVEWAETGASEEGCQVQLITDNASAVLPDSLVQNVLVNTVVQGQEGDRPLLDDKGNDLYCEECHASYKDQCDVEGRLSFMLDSSTPMGLPQRALLTLPHGLVVGRSSIPGAGLGVLNQGAIVAPGMHFGPCEGEVTTRDSAVTSDYSWEVWNSKGESEYIDSARDTHSNWMRYVNCARNAEEGNLTALQYRGNVFFHCCRSILPGDELLFWPGGRFIDTFKDPSDEIWLRKSTPSEVTTDLSSQVFICCQCQLSFTTETYIQRHKEQLHPLDLSPVSALCELDKHLSNRNMNPDSMSSSVGELGYRCPQRPKSFKQKGHVQRNMRAVHSNVRPYCCPQCRKCFAQGYDLARHHLRVHGTKKKRGVVEVRGEEVREESSLPPPSDSAWEPEPPSNDPPTETQTGRAPSQQRLRNLRVKSTKVNTLKQRETIAKKRFHSDAPDMEEEEEKKDAVGEAQYSCTDCQRTYGNPESLKAHQCIPFVVGPPLYSCSTCGVAFKRYTTLKKHKLNKHPKEKMLYCCTHCGRYFSQAAGLQCNLEAEVCKDIQLSSEAVPCSYCQFSFSEERYLRKHVKRHHPDKYVSQASGLGSGLIQSEQKAGEVHLCLQCGKSYEYVQSFKAHRCCQSVAAKLHLCNDCGKSFSCFYSLKHHQRIHTGEKPYRCSYCEKCFSHSGHLNVHLRIHTGEKSFVCTECGESFRQSGDLKRHERKHTGVKPCTCPECGKSFSRPQSLKAHLMLHNGERQYKCDQCGKSFSRNYHLTRHHEKTHS